MYINPDFTRGVNRSSTNETNGIGFDLDGKFIIQHDRPGELSERTELKSVSSALEFD